MGDPLGVVALDAGDHQSDVVRGWLPWIEKVRGIRALGCKPLPEVERLGGLDQPVDMVHRCVIA